MTVVNNKNRTHSMRINILRRRYLWKNKNSKIVETEKQMFRRVARVIAEVEQGYGATVEEIRTLRERFYKLISRAIVLPNPLRREEGCNVCDECGYSKCN